MEQFDFCFAWNWQYDQQFIEALASACHTRGVSCLQVHPHNLVEILALLEAGELQFRAFLDRASDSDDRFSPLVDFALQRAPVYINRFQLARRAWNKPLMHQVFTQAGLLAPHILVLPPYNEQPDMHEPDLAPLGGCFAIKPAHGGGGKGVIVGATSWQQALAARMEYPNDQYLLQAHVTPLMLGNRPAWFRVIYCFGQVFPCYWDPLTHVYTPLTPFEQEAPLLQPLFEIPQRMAALCSLELFSTEIALTDNRQFVIVDYVNDPIDLRLQSAAFEGVPDAIVAGIAGTIAHYVAPVYQLMPVYAD